MNARLATCAWLLLGGTTLLLAACSGSDAPLVEPNAESPISSRSADEQILDTYKREMTQVYTMVAECQNDRTDACFRRVQQSLETGVAPQDIAIHFDDSVGPKNWLTDRLAEVKSFSKENICPAVNYVVIPARQYGDALRIYFVLGATASSGAVVQGIVGGEATWELTQHESSGFTYAGGGVGNSVGASVGAYGSFAVSGLGGNILSNWSGWFASTSVSLSFPGTRIGVGASAYCGFDPYADGGPGCVPGGVIGAAIQASFGLDLANAIAIQVGLSGTYYKVDRNLVKFMHGWGWLSQDRGDHLKFVPGYNVSGGALQAVDILFYGPGIPQVSAALTAVGVDAARAVGKTLAEWCAPDEGADTCPGRPDGMHCSSLSRRNAFLCRGGSNAGADACAAGEHCVGTNGDSIVCAPDEDAGRSN